MGPLTTVPRFTMYQITEDSLEKLDAAANRLFTAFRNSPLWVMLKDDPMIKGLQECLDNISAQWKKQTTNLNSTTAPLTSECSGATSLQPKKDDGSSSSIVQQSAATTPNQTKKE